ncbi:hypothetical protein BU15DRAFT_89261 [Melanogaster broomeanus]|nr:hypothetical protein BU15DRAFT_89261 [Melanogaster broomeanus]
MANICQNGATRACKCLNVRILPQPQSGKPPNFLMNTSSDSEYTLTYVGEQGLAIAHPQLTMRTRKMGPPTADISRRIRFTTLTCLVCQTLAYRVQQLVASDVDGQEGPLLPSPDWVEQEALLSSSGWIEVHKSCLVAEDVARLSSSLTYSPTFGVALPESSARATTVPAQPAYEASQDFLPQASPLVGPFLSNLQPLLPPAPFVPSHPVFSHLSSIAVNESQSLRSTAEEHLAEIVREQLVELGKAEDKLRRDVEELWRKFVENVGEVERETGGRLRDTRRRESSRGLTLNTSGVSGTPLVSVRDFIPVSRTMPRLTSTSPPPVPRASSLSASLATSAFHHPRVAQERAAAHERPSTDSPRSPPPYSSHPSSLGSVDSALSSSSESPPELFPLVKGDTIVQPFKRSMDESRDTSVSFRYFTILEADAARARHLQQPNAGSEETPCKPAESDRETGDLKSAKMASDTETPAKEKKEDRSKKCDSDSKPPAEDAPRNRRKVKFDIKEAHTTDTTSAEMNGEDQPTRKARDIEEMIFDLEDGSSEPESSDAAPALPFVETVHVQPCRARARVSSHAGLPASLSSLRPTSLPVYSTIQSKVAKGAATKQLEGSNSGVSHPTSITTALEEGRTEDAEQLDAQEEEILKLVAAHTPSHRGAWQPHSKAWQMFVRRRRHGVPGALIPEEVEDGSGRITDDTDDSDCDAPRDTRRYYHDVPPGIPASLPIDIGPLAHRREPLSLASYQPKTSLTDRAGTIVPAFPDGSRRHTSSALRRASYAERDRTRARDPGALDFPNEDGADDEDEESDAEPSRVDTANEGRGRQRALKILEARSKVPEAGMWMSLA